MINSQNIEQLQKREVINLIYNQLPLGTDLLVAIRIYKELIDKKYIALPQDDDKLSEL